MFCYAQLNDEGICVGISQLSGEVKNDLLIPLETMDTGILGKKYNQGRWEEVPEEPEESGALGAQN